MFLRFFLDFFCWEAEESPLVRLAGECCPNPEGDRGSEIGGHGLMETGRNRDHLEDRYHYHVAITMPFLPHDWEWFIFFPPIKMVILMGDGANGIVLPI